MKIEEISLAKLQTAVRVIEKRRDDALSNLKAYQGSHALKSATERERNASLHGVLHGLGAAFREFEIRCPLEFYGSEGSDEDEAKK